MAFKLNYEAFPFESRDREIWYFIIDWESKTKHEFCTVQEKKDIVPFLRTIISSDNKNKHELLGVWNGQYKTDIFIIPIEDGYLKLREHFSETNL